ncbi:MAG: LacI family transcriptional regulator [Paenibacillus sp.]|jgi:LacI family transcriptional regulator|nr:LacI family transcriptional regulator [Paenibacillus sp.]
MPRKKQVTLRTLASKLGLSVYTVSKALRGKPGMSEHTRHEVFELAQKLGYFTKEQERSLLYEGIPVFPAKSRRFIFAAAADLLLISPLHRQLFKGLQERLSELGHKVEAVDIPLNLDNGIPFEQWLEQHGVLYADGIFITPVVPVPIEAKLLALPIPRVLLNFPPAGVLADSIIWDVYDAVQQSVQYLVNMGHERIMYIGNTIQARGYKLRWQAFNEAISEAGLRTSPEDHMTETYKELDAWMAKFKQIFRRIRPTALLCTIDKDLSWIYYACSTMGIQIPGDCSIISLETAEDSFIPNVSRPNLLIKETGYRAADRMLWRIANPHLPCEHIRLRGGFYKGETVMNPPAR